jgi:ATP-dependent exoDNAse (exonuclease V) beta subunit
MLPDFAGVPVKMILDRVFEVNGELVIVDLKTSQQTPTNTLQLGFYKVGILKTFGIDVKWGTYWMARQHGVSPLVSLVETTS